MSRQKDYVRPMTSTERKKVQRAAKGGEIQGYKCGGKVTARSKKSAKKGFKGTF